MTKQIDPTKLAKRLRNPDVEFEEDVAPLLAEAVEILGLFDEDEIGARAAWANWLRRVAEAQND